MAGLSPTTLALARQYDTQIVSGIDHYEVDGLNLKIYTTSGQTLMMTFPTPEVGIEDMYIDANQELIVVFEDGSTRDCGAVPGGGTIDTRVVTSLPTINISPTTIYLLASKDANGDDIYEEYLYINGKWERFGTRTSAVEEIQSNSAATTDIDGII